MYSLSVLSYHVPGSTESDSGTNYVPPTSLALTANQGNNIITLSHRTLSYMHVLLATITVHYVSFFVVLQDHGNIS